MRRLAQELSVVPMALYKHVADREDLLDGIVEVIIREIDLPVRDLGWRSAIRLRVLSARSALQRHRWARQAIESRARPTPGVLEYQESFAEIFLTGGFPPTWPTPLCTPSAAGCGGSHRSCSTAQPTHGRRRRRR